jgi:tRNA(Ile2) C34 agmatinyltransferase TiaS
MPKCPICNEDLEELDKDNYICKECQESIPKEHAGEDKVPCCDPLNPCK